jgi:hypothetical protein
LSKNVSNLLKEDSNFLHGSVQEIRVFFQQVGNIGMTNQVSRIQESPDLATGSDPKGDEIHLCLPISDVHSGLEKEISRAGRRFLWIASQSPVGREIHVVDHMSPI